MLVAQILVVLFIKKDEKCKIRRIRLKNSKVTLSMPSEAVRRIF